jgi:hypothetical protein
MKNVIALAVSLLVPAAPVLADVAAEQTSAAITTKENDRAAQMVKAMGPLQEAPAVVPLQTVTTPAGTPATTDSTGKPPAAKPRGSDTGNITADPVKEKKKPGMFAKMKTKLMNFVTKHPVLAGAILGGMLCIAGGPAIFVIGVALGAVAGDVADYEIDKFKHPAS